MVLREEKYCYREIARKLRISVNAVNTTLQRYAETGSIEDRKRTGRPCETSKSEEKHLRLSSLRNRRLTVPQLTSKLNETRTIPVSD
jgi:transposase